jgi:hypothetical protein
MVLMAYSPLISRISEELNVILVEAILDVRRRPRRHKIRPPERVDRDQDDVAGASAVAHEADERCQSGIAHIAAVPIVAIVDLDGSEVYRQAARRQQRGKVMFG